MSKSVVICEKPSQAKAIKAAVGSRYGVVLPARGHILTLKEPDDVREDWKDWSATLLWPGKFYEKVPVADTRRMLNEIRDAARDADTIIIATDCDREGQLIGGEIVDYIGFRGVVKRAIFNAEDPKSLQESFAKLHPNEKFHGLYMAGQAREQADQVTNLSLTRTATVTFGDVIPRLSGDEARLFDLIARQYLAALAPDFEYRQTTVEMNLPWRGHDWAFRASGRVPLILGWKEIAGSAPLKAGEEEQLFPEIRAGEQGNIFDTAVRTVTTKAPARYTEGALIKVMKEAWRLVDDPEKRARLKEAKGIGTPATRGDVVKGLLTQGQLIAKGKTLQPSAGGMALYDLLMEIAPNVVDPARTAQWEIVARQSG